MKMVQVTDELAHDHYETIGTMRSRHGDEIFKVTTDYMKSWPVLAMVREGVESIAIVRKMTWATEPKSAAPGTIRWDYSHLSYGYVDGNKSRLLNIVHASADADEAAPEIALWFNDDELFDHEITDKLYKRWH